LKDKDNISSDVDDRLRILKVSHDLGLSKLVPLFLPVPNYLVHPEINVLFPPILSAKFSKRKIKYL
jgi:hypothetical protein